MADIVLFRPRAELNAADNLRGFIDVCRDRVTVFGANLAFDTNVWDVTEALDLKAKSGASRAVFSNWATVTDAAPMMMAEPFCAFAKAYFRYQHGVKPTKSIGARLAALRALETALTENGEEGNPVRVDAGALNRSAQLIKDRFTAAVAYRVAGQLEMLANFMTNHRLTVIAVRWRNPLKRPSDGARVGQEFDRRRHEKLPSPAALEALANAFRVAVEPVDVLVSSVAAVLCSAPERINEVLHLPTDCEVRRRDKGDMVYGLRWWPSKGAAPQVKWLVPSMASVVREAIAKIRQQTDEARRIARWYEQRPRNLYLPRQLEHLRAHDLLSMREAGEVLFTDPVHRTVPRVWCATHNVTTVKHSRQLFASFAALERAVLALLPRGFPIVNAERGLKVSDALCVIQRNTLHERKARYRCAIEMMDHGDIQSRLGSRSETGIRSIFDRLAFCEDDGSPIHITTHQFRHYLNTLAQAGGMSQLDIAKWSGRTEVRQNAAYDHVSDRDMLVQLREAVGDDHRMMGPLATLHHTTLIPRDEFARLKVPTAHTTEVGFCVHDYTMSPCQLHRDCLSCEELICVKGDPVKAAAIRHQRTETQMLLAQASQTAQRGDSGANRWVDHQRETLERLDQLCGILDDPQVPNGTFIQLSIRKQPAGLGQERPVGATRSLPPTPRRLTAPPSAVGAHDPVHAVDDDSEGVRT